MGNQNSIDLINLKNKTDYLMNILNVKENILYRNTPYGYVSLNNTADNIDNINNVLDLLNNKINISNIENTSDINKPISINMQAELDTKENISDKNKSEGYVGLDNLKKINSSQIPVINKSLIKLDNAENTSDINKPISIVMQTELDTKENISDKNKSEGYVGLDNLKKIDFSQMPAINKSFIKLDNTENTSDINKPISIVMQTELDTKENIVNKNEPNGYVGLDSLKKIDIKQLPFNINKSFIELNNAENTSDINKPISIVMQTELDTKENISDKNKSEGYVGLDNLKKIDFSQMPAINKSLIKLDNAENTSDINKPISIVMQTELDTKENISDKNKSEGYVGLDNLKKIDFSQMPAINKSLIKLDNAENTSDINKPISIVMQTELDTKENISDKNKSEGYVGLDNLKKIDFSQMPAINKSLIKLDNAENTSDINKPISIAMQTELDTKENIVNKNEPNGYVGLDNLKKIDIKQLPIFDFSNNTSSNLHLENLNNTSDINKPISINMQTELDTKEDIVNKNEPDGYVGLDDLKKIDIVQMPIIDKNIINLKNLNNTNDLNKPISTFYQNVLDLKENIINKNVENGYVGLNSDKKIDIKQIKLTNSLFNQLDMIDNTSDLNKSISTATQNALNLKEKISNKNEANGYLGLDNLKKINISQLPTLDKSIILLNNIDNISDLDKSVSTFMKSKLDLKEDIVNKNIENGYVGLDNLKKINYAQLNNIINKSFIRLENVDNTSDLNKSIPANMQTLLNEKENSSNKNVANGYAGLDDTGKLFDTQIPIIKNASKISIGLGNVDNTSDVNKPISTAVQTALNLKENTANKNVANGYASLDASTKILTAQLPNLTKTNFSDLGNVDNTSDVNKPISTAVQTALNLKENTANKNVANGYAGLDASSKINSAQLPTLTKTNFSDLGNVDNTSDVNKPISTAVQTALNLKENTANKNATNGYAGLDSSTKILTAQLPTLTKTNFSDLGNVDNTSDVNKPISTAVQTALNLKENTTNKNVASGYAGLDASSKINSAQLPTFTKANFSDLGNVDNTSDVNKPISTAVQTALNLKENTTNKNVASGYAGLDASSKINSAQLPTFTKANFSDLGNVDNTSDVNKPISTAVQTALNLKENNANKNVASGYAGLDASSKITSTQIPIITKTLLGLGNVDNTSDVNKPISTTVQTDLNLKENIANKNAANGYAGLDASSKINSAQLPTFTKANFSDLENVDNTSDLDKPISSITQIALNLKENTANKNVANGYAGLDASSKILINQIPTLTTDDLTYGNTKYGIISGALIDTMNKNLSTYAGLHNSTKTYLQNIYVISTSGIFYKSLIAVPANIVITNTTYWTPIFYLYYNKYSVEIKYNTTTTKDNNNASLTLYTPIQGSVNIRFTTNTSITSNLFINGLYAVIPTSGLFLIQLIAYSNNTIHNDSGVVTADPRIRLNITNASGTVLYNIDNFIAPKFGVGYGEHTVYIPQTGIIKLVSMNELMTFVSVTSPLTLKITSLS